MGNHTRRCVLAAAIAATLATTGIGFAQQISTLQITSQTTQADPISLTLADLDALPQTSFTTTTIWTDGPVTFSGVALKTLLGDLANSGTTLEMVALNDYKVTMPVADIEDAAPIVATRMNDAPMSVRDKGPYWIVFPYDSDPKYKTETTYARSIWQLNRLKIVD